MKNISFLFVFILFSTGGTAQLNLDHVYQSSINKGIVQMHLHNGGFKYLELDIVTNSKMNIYNINHTLYKTINIPILPGGASTGLVYYVSDKLFDTDNLIEYVILGYLNGIWKFYIYKEDGTQMMFRDSSNFNSSPVASVIDIFASVDGVYFDGQNTKLRITTAYGQPSMRDQIFTLPGSIPCIQCSPNIVVTGLKTNPTSTEEKALFYPNPVSDQLKLQYTLPKEYKVALIKIQDLDGKLIDEYRISSSFDFIYLPSSYNNGLYLYSLIVDGNLIKTEKIVLNK